MLLPDLADLDIATACGAVVDGSHDNGIDTVYIDQAERIIYLVQPKWNNAHDGGIENGDVLKFLHGAKDLISSRYEKFNDKVKAREAEIENAF